MSNIIHFTVYFTFMKITILHYYLHAGELWAVTISQLKTMQDKRTTIVHRSEVFIFYQS